ncbi:MAG TPA: YdeI/OmpD-associated family protein [Anaerolineales bacterium]|nr:YdeI/OmpD-associated family protein [Anaerolineales bacterium]
MKRPHYPIPADVREAIERRGLMDRYHLRPPYQQNDYIGWIDRAKRADTRQKRLNQMLDELEKGNVYMRMRWNPDPRA